MPLTILARVVAAFAALASMLAYGIYVHDLGFPDGFVSELAAAQRVLALLFIALSVAVALVLAWLSVGASQRSCTAVLATTVLYAAVLIGTTVADAVLRATLRGSGGG